MRLFLGAAAAAGVLTLVGCADHPSTSNALRTNDGILIYEPPGNRADSFSPS